MTHCLGTLRIIADSGDAETSEHASRLYAGLSLLAQSDMEDCDLAERAQCQLRKRCDIVVVLFGAEQSEKTAASACLCCRNRGGVMIVLEPEGRERDLPLVGDVIRKTYSNGSNMLLMVLEGIRDYYADIATRLQSSALAERLGILDKILSTCAEGDVPTPVLA